MVSVLNKWKADSSIYQHKNILICESRNSGEEYKSDVLY